MCELCTRTYREVVKLRWPGRGIRVDKWCPAGFDRLLLKAMKEFPPFRLDAQNECVSCSFS
jgi:hypothetical protein